MGAHDHALRAAPAGRCASPQPASRAARAPRRAPCRDGGRSTRGRRGRGGRHARRERGRRPESPAARRWSSPASARYTIRPPAARSRISHSSSSPARGRRPRRTRRCRSNAERRTAKLAPQTMLGLAVLGAEVERRDRRVLAAAAARRWTLEARPDRAAEGLGIGVAPAPSTSARSQPGGASTSSSTNAIERRREPRAAPMLRAAFRPRRSQRADDAARRAAAPRRRCRRWSRRRPRAARAE